MLHHLIVVVLRLFRVEVLLFLLDQIVAAFLLEAEILICDLAIV